MTQLPESTYRLQLHAGFTFRDATAIVPYLRDLGITHVYASPILRAKAGSTHGYDVIDHCHLNPELGTEADFEALASTLRAHDMSMIVDIVPNHVGVATNDNAWWNDVLANGPASKYGKYFDIDWKGSPRPELHGKVLLPLLGKSYGEALDAGELTLSHEGGSYWIHYYDRRFPLSPRTQPAQAGGTFDETAARINADRDALHDLLERQHYRLACWRTAPDEINYRRFFDVNDLAALAMEREEVFDETHALTLRLIREGKITGLRLDHPDGLYDPAAYFTRLQTAVTKPGDTSVAPATRLYVLAEKILAMDETLPRNWAVHGTTGYDFLAQVNAFLIDPAGEDAMTAIYHEFTGDDTPFDERVYRNKRLILRIALASELHMLAHRFDRLAQRDRHWRDFTLNALIEALAEVIACFGVYRTYISSSHVTDVDRGHIESAVAKAKARAPRTDPAIFDFIQDALLQHYPEHFDAEARAEQVRIAGKFQQLTSPTTAKGIEDTTFYQYHRLISLNEVGGEPAKFGVSPDELHAFFTDRQKHWPHAMSALSTHDTKRSEDVRARINVLSEIPGEWRSRVFRWREVNARENPPHPGEEYLLYQTLVGAFPIEATADDVPASFIERASVFMTKAMRESKLRSTWTQPDEAYEQRVTSFVGHILKSKAFLDDFVPFQKQISRWGMLNSLSQTLLKLTAPGMPDTYQGTELWDLSLVDPDNRRPVDYDTRRKILGKIDSADASSLQSSLDDGRAKLVVTKTALHARRLHPGLFSVGDYIPLKVTGDEAAHYFAFARRHEGAAAIVIVPRLVASLRQALTASTTVELPAGLLESRRWTNAFDGSIVGDLAPGSRLAVTFTTFPVALLLSA